MTGQPSPEFSRSVAIDGIPAYGPGAATVVSVTATAAELAALALRMRLPAIQALRCRFELARIGGRGFIIGASGLLEARVTQVCVRTLDPFEAELRERFSIRFVPAGKESESDDPEADDEIPYDGGEIDLGEAAAEQLALALNPYPHKPGAALPADVVAEDAPEAEAANPFAALIGRSNARPAKPN